MPVYSVTVSDTLTILRTATVELEADTPEQAEELALDACCKGGLQWHEEQIDNTPYEVIGEPKQLSFPHDPRHCPSNHWNRGDDICADCGTYLA